jgi:membrane dipeptidase
MSDTPLPVFDGHNDLLLRLWRADPETREAMWLTGDGHGHLDLPRMRRGRFAGGFFAVYVPSSDGPLDMDALMANPPYDAPLPDPIPLADAQAVALGMVGILFAMERAAKGAFRVCRSAEEVDACFEDGTIAAILHMEGAEAIDPGLDALHVFHAMGLRSIGPVWSRPTAFGHGVPFRFPRSPDTGPGLTDAGKALVRECDALGVMIDLSHLNEKGFDDVAAISTAPLVATHSNAWDVTNSTRNLTDRQLDIIAERDGMVGLNFATGFLRPDGKRDPDIGWDPILRHLDHLISRLGETRVGLGSDFDGATIPDGIGDAAGLPALQDALRSHGYDDALMERICHRNWRALLARTIG